MSHFEIEKKELLKGLGIMQGIAGRKTTLPILSHIYMEWKENSLFLTGTDLETGIQEELSATIRQEGKASVSSKKLYEITRELPEQKIHIQKKENQWINLKCGKSIFNIAGLDPEEFPSLPAFQEKFSIVPSKVIREMIEKVVYAASNEDSRYHLNGVLIVQPKKKGGDILRMVSTDGHRLSLIDREGLSIKVIEDKEGKVVPKGIIVPKKGIMEIKKILGEKDGSEEIGIYFDQTHGFFKLGKSLMVVRLIEGDFPEYEQVIPKNNDKAVTVERDKIYETIKRVSTMVSERAEGIKFSLKKNSMELSSYHQDFGDASEEIEVQYDGPPLEIGFNARYLIDALNVIDTPNVVLELKDEGSPCLLRPEAPEKTVDQIGIVMPMRI